MLIKVRPDLYVNTDHIVSVCFPSTNKATIELLGMRTFDLTESAARGMMEFLEPNESLIFEEDTPPPVANLKNKIAVLLRDTWKGVSFEQLTAILYDSHIPAAQASQHESDIKFALIELETERVVARVNNLWYHTSSSEAQAWLAWLASIRSNPDPSSANEALPDASDQAAEYSADSIALKSEN